MRKIVVDAGLQIVRERRCMFSLTSRVQVLLPKRRFVYNTSWITTFDDYLSNLPIWPKKYHAKNVIQKLRPHAVFFCTNKNSLRLHSEGPEYLQASCV
jgi:hypothetical protein